MPLTNQNSGILSVALWSLVLFSVVSLVSSTISEKDSLPHHGRCEPITIPLCKDILYNETIMPNLLNHQKQEDAGLEVHQFFPLVKVKCSPDLQIFLCSVYAPVCTVLDKPIPPCRSLCLSARGGCEGLMNKFGFQWPESLDCSRYPEAGVGNELCVGENNTSSGSSHGGQEPGYRNPYKIPGKLLCNPLYHVNDECNFYSGASSPNYPKNPLNELGSSGSYPGSFPSAPSQSWFPGSYRPGFTSSNSTSKDLGFVCPAQFKVPKGLDYVVRVGGKVTHDCGAPCTGMFFNEEEVQFSRIWVGVWGSICMASCLFTVSNYLNADAISCIRGKFSSIWLVFVSGSYIFARRAPFPLSGATCRFFIRLLFYGGPGLRYRLRYGRFCIVQSKV